MLYLGFKKVVAKSGTTLYIVLQLFLPCNTPVCCIRQVWFVNGKTRNIAILNCSAAMLPPFSLIRDFRKEKTRGNVSKISVNHACYRGQKVTLVAVIGGFRSDLSITCMIDGNFGNVSAGVLFSKVAYQRKRW